MNEIAVETQAKKYGILKTIFLSFFSKDAYQDIAWRREGSGSLFLLLLSYSVITLIILVIFVILFFLPVKEKAIEIVNETAEIALPQLPETMEIRDGQLVVPKNEPYLIEFEGKVVVIIDTSGQYSINDVSVELPVVFTKEYMAVYNESKHRVESFRFQEMCVEGIELCNRNFTREELYEYTLEFIEKYAPYFPIIFLIVGLISALFFGLFAFVYYFIQAVLFSLVALAIKAILKLDLKYNDILRITIFAMVPMLIINIVLIFLNIQYSTFIYALIIIGYIAYALTALKEKRVQT